MKLLTHYNKIFFGSQAKRERVIKEVSSKTLEIALDIYFFSKDHLVWLF